MNWVFPPFIGQKVTLNPASEHYGRFTEQSDGTDGYIIKLESVPHNWLFSGRDIAFNVAWGNGHTNQYSTKSTLPLSTFKEVKRIKFRSTDFMPVYNKKTEDLVLNEVIMNGNSVVETIMFDKAMRIHILERHIEWYEKQDSDVKDKESAQMRYAGTLEELESTKRAEAELLFIDEASEDEGKSMSTEVENTDLQPPQHSQQVQELYQNHQEERSFRGYAPGEIIIHNGYTGQGISNLHAQSDYNNLGRAVYQPSWIDEINQRATRESTSVNPCAEIYADTEVSVSPTPFHGESEVSVLARQREISASALIHQQNVFMEQYETIKGRLRELENNSD